MNATTAANEQPLNSPKSCTPPATSEALEPPFDTDVVVETQRLDLPPDAREQLYNDGSIGPIDHIQVSTQRIVRLNGILYDVDPQNLRGGPLLLGLSQDPQEFYEHCVQHWLANHPVLQHAEVRATGTGLHVIIWLDPPVNFTSDAERKRWCSIVKIVQSLLPADPMAPGITATTRAIGSINSKNGQVVRRLKEGTPVSPEEMIALSEEMCASPFRTLFKVLTGCERMSPCPFCGKESITALDYAGVCYGCGKVTFERLCEELFEPKKATEVEHG